MGGEERSRKRLVKILGRYPRRDVLGLDLINMISRMPVRVRLGESVAGIGGCQLQAALLASFWEGRGQWWVRCAAIGTSRNREEGTITGSLGIELRA